MLFDNDTAPKTRVDARRFTVENATEEALGEAAKKESRYRPLRDGSLVLALIEIELDAFGLVPIKPSETGKSASVATKVHIKSGRSTGRWFYQSFMVSGFAEKVRESDVFLRRAISCFDVDVPKGSRSFGMIANRVIPVRLGIRPHWQTGKAGNFATALAADPRSDVYAQYVKLVDKLEDAVPGWDLYDDSRAKNLVLSRMTERSTVVGTDADGRPMTAYDVRRIRNSKLVTEARATHADLARRHPGAGK